MTQDQIKDLEKQRDNFIFSAKKIENSKNREDILYKHSCVKSAYDLQLKLISNAS